MGEEQANGAESISAIQGGEHGGYARPPARTLAVARGADGSVEKYLYRDDDIFKNICDDIKEEIEEKNNIELVFPGKWRNDYILADGREGTEEFELRNINEYHIDPFHIFNLDSIFVDRQKRVIEFRKVGVEPDKRKAFNTLRIIDNNHYEGTEDHLTTIKYTRVS